MKLEKKDIQHIANLARLELTDDEIEKYREQLSGVLDFIDQLQEVDTTGVEPTAQVTGLENILREDKAKPWDKNEQQKAFEQAPSFQDDQYRVKRVL